jgi:transcription initiation factor IIF auxiliary subunit
MVRRDEEYIKELGFGDFRIDDVIFFLEKLKVGNLP